VAGILGLPQRVSLRAQAAKTGGRAPVWENSGIGKLQLLTRAAIYEPEVSLREVRITESRLDEGWLTPKVHRNHTE